MKIGTLLRLAAMAALVVMLSVWSVAIAAADSGGDSPTNGIPVVPAPTETCMSQTLAPGAQVWFKVTYHAGTDLELRSQNADGVTFAVYDPQKASDLADSPKPTGLLTADSNEPLYTSTWRGHLAQGQVTDFYYVLATNTNTFPLTFSFCAIEWPIFTPPPMPMTPSSPVPPVQLPGTLDIPR